MIAAVFLILWMDNQPLPTARFIRMYESADACIEYIDRSELEKEIKRQLACVEMGAALGGTKKL
jgi:hypothetical protein